jgi:hypothetical protein
MDCCDLKTRIRSWVPAVGLGGGREPGTYHPVFFFRGANSELRKNGICQIIVPKIKIILNSHPPSYRAVFLNRQSGENFYRCEKLLSYSIYRGDEGALSLDSVSTCFRYSYIGEKS